MERPESLPVSEGQAQCELDDPRVEQVAGIAAQRQQGSEVRSRGRRRWEYRVVEMAREQVEELSAEL